MDKNFQEAIFNEIRIFLDPIVVASGDTERVFDLFLWLGWDMRSLLGSDPSAFLAKVTTIANAVIDIEQLVAQPPKTLSELAAALGKIEAAVDAIRALPSTVGGVHLPELSELPHDVIEKLFLSYLFRRTPVIYHLFDLLTIIRDEHVSYVTHMGKIVRLPAALPALHLERLPLVVKDPVGELEQEYAPNGIPTEAEATEVGKKLFSKISAVMMALGFEPLVGAGTGPTELDPDYQEMLEGMLTFVHSFTLPDGTDTEIGATLSLAPTNIGGPGVLIAPFGRSELEYAFERWDLKFKLGVGIDGVVVRPDSLEFVGASTATRVDLSLLLTRLADDEVAFQVGSTEGTRLEVGQFSIAVNAALSQQQQDYGILSEIRRAAFIVVPSDGDSFLNRVLPSEGLRTEFDLAIGWSNRTGFYFRGSGALEATLPVHVSLGPISVESVYLAIRTEDADIHVVAAASPRIKLGPVEAAVDRVGLEALFSFPSDGGNLGPAEIALSFKPPTGIGIAVDAAAITGGGYLSFDSVNGRYSGHLQLKIHDITVTAFGLIETKLPGGASGFSFLILISTEFNPPIQLGFGFGLKGVGGLIGINRTVDTPKLQEGLCNRSFNNLLFPQDVTRNAPQIISDLRSVFPAEEGHYVFGPLGKIVWPVSQPLLQAELGLVLELPRQELLLLGHVEVLVPAANPIVALKLDILGVLEFSKKRLQIESVIYDSNIAGFPLSGGAALLVEWGDRPEFIFSIGGFHPRFQPPPGFPALKRLTVCLDNDGVRLTAEMYLAITPNTFQIGASAELVAGGKYNVHGWISFDALIEFDPFRFRTDISAGVELRRNTRVLAGVRLKGTLEGPAPWHIHGKASVSFLFLSVSVSFDRTFGETKFVTPGTVDIAGELRKAIEDPRNWSATLPPSVQRVVTTAAPKLNPPAVLVDPMGAVALHQRVAPLNTEIQKFAEAKLDPPVTFSVAKVMVGNNTVPRADYSIVKDFFAPGQFRYLSEDEKFSRPSFEKMDAGVAFGSNAVESEAMGREVVLEYETEIIDSPFDPPRPVNYDSPYQLSGANLLALSKLGASALGGLSTTGARKFAPDPRRPALAELIAEGFQVVSADDLSFRPDITSSPLSKTEAYRALDSYLATHPQERGRLQVVPSHEL